MKRIIYCFIAVMALAFTASCEKASQGLVLVADKTEIVADGEDEVSFTIMKDGEDITHTSGVTGNFVYLSSSERKRFQILDFDCGRIYFLCILRGRAFGTGDGQCNLNGGNNR